MSLKQRGLAIVAALAVPALLVAQQPGPAIALQNRAPETKAARILVAAFRTTGLGQSGANTGVELAEDFGRRIERAFPRGEVDVLPAEGPAESGHPGVYAPPVRDSNYFKSRAVVLRADEYVAGSLIRVGNLFRAEADLVLTRDMSARQPLVVGEASNMGDALNALVKELTEARKQMDGERRCSNGLREGKYAQAIELANAAIVAYPKATLARICLVRALESSKAPPAEIMSVARELFVLDPRSDFGLTHLAQAFRRENQRDSVRAVRDSVLGDTTYFIRASLAFAADSQWPQAFVAAAQGVAKFPANGFLAGLATQFLERDQRLQKVPQALLSFKAVVTNVHLGAGIKLPAAKRAKSCPLVKEAKAHFVEALINMPPERPIMLDGGMAMLYKLAEVALAADWQADAIMRSIPNCR